MCKRVTGENTYVREQGGRQRRWGEPVNHHAANPSNSEKGKDRSQLPKGILLTSPLLVGGAPTLQNGPCLVSLPQAAMDWEQPRRCGCSTPGFRAQHCTMQSAPEDPRTCQGVKRASALSSPNSGNSSAPMQAEKPQVWVGSTPHPRPVSKWAGTAGGRQLCTPRSPHWPAVEVTQDSQPRAVTVSVKHFNINEGWTFSEEIKP